MRSLEPANRLTIFLGGKDQYRHRPLYAEIVRRARESGLAGASVFRGIEGFGTSARIHSARVMSLGDPLPIVIVIVDAADKIDRFACELDGFVDDGLAVIDRVEVLHYGNRARRTW